MGIKYYNDVCPNLPENFFRNFTVRWEADKICRQKLNKWYFKKCLFEGNGVGSEIMQPYISEFALKILKIFWSMMKSNV